MMTQIYYEVDNRDLLEMMDRVDDFFVNGMTRFLQDEVVEDILKDRLKYRFQFEGDSASGQWSPLRPETVDIRLKFGYGGAHPINYRTGDLQSFLETSGSSTRSSKGESAVRWPEKQPTGKNRKSLTQAQKGGRNGSPARPVLAVGELDLQETLVRLARRLDQIS